MTISTKGRYALRIMMDLANHLGETIKLKDIAARQEISEKYMEQIISVLNKAGYVRSNRGAQGGYQLVMMPKDYTVGMVLRLTEGSLAPVECLSDNALPCEREGKCATIEV
jgi:Rrf2 family protein